jgi:predicted secreted acid phosphatase
MASFIKAIGLYAEKKQISIKNMDETILDNLPKKGRVINL